MNKWNTRNYRIDVDWLQMTMNANTFPTVTVRIRLVRTRRVPMCVAVILAMDTMLLTPTEASTAWVRLKPTYLLYQALVMSVLLYGAETWTLLAADIGTLEAFHRPMKCQRQMLNIHWWDHNHQCRDTPENMPVNNQRNPTQPSPVCLFSAMLHAWTLKSQQTRPCSWWWTVMRAGSHRQAGPDIRAVLVAPGSTLSRRMLMLSHFHIYGELRFSRVNGPSGLGDDDNLQYNLKTLTFCGNDQI